MREMSVTDRGGVKVENDRDTDSRFDVEPLTSQWQGNEKMELEIIGSYFDLVAKYPHDLMDLQHRAYQMLSDFLNNANYWNGFQN